jgi:ArsR family transcriptional regulator
MEDDSNNFTLIDNDKDILRATAALKALAHPLRLKILCVLKDGEQTVTSIVKEVGSSQSNISQHIDILRSKDIVESRRDGNKILCSVKDKKILQLVANIKEVFCNGNK